MYFPTHSKPQSVCWEWRVKIISHRTDCLFSNSNGGEMHVNAPKPDTLHWIYQETSSRPVTTSPAPSIPTWRWRKNWPSLQRPNRHIKHNHQLHEVPLNRSTLQHVSDAGAVFPQYQIEDKRVNFQCLLHSKLCFQSNSLFNRIYCPATLSRGEMGVENDWVK